MSWIRTISPKEADGELKNLYDVMLKNSRMIPKMRQLNSLRPEVLKVMNDLSKVADFGGTTLGREREELITFVVAYHLNCSYCSIAHGGGMARRTGASTEEIVNLACNYQNAGLDDKDVAMLDYALKVATDPESLDETDITKLREHGFDDVAIFDIVLNTAYRVMLTRMAAALGIDAEDWWKTIPKDLREAMSVGRKL